VFLNVIAMIEQELRQIQDLVYAEQFRRGLRILRKSGQKYPKDPNLFMNRGGFLIDVGTGLSCTT
jgi:hypothetical protein